MRRFEEIVRSLLLMCAVLWCALALAAEPPSLDPHLEPLRPLLEKTWRGVFTGGDPAKPVVDVMRWERAMNGQVVRVLHSINDGAYGGETLYRWDEAKKAVTFHYFTTAGFMTVGTVSFESGKFTTLEKVEGNAGGITEVRGTLEILPDGTVCVKAEHKRGETWDLGRETIYREDSAAKVVFR